MTLILALGNSEQVIQVADRRLTGLAPARGTVDDDFTKAGVWTCADGRVTFGFSGFATKENFNTQRLLLEQIIACSKPDFQLKPTVERLKDVLTNTFREHATIISLPRSARRLSVMFTGYWDLGQSPCLVNLLLTNFQDFDAGIDDIEAWSEFRGWYFAQVPPGEMSGEPTMIQRIGAWPTLPDSLLDPLRSMLEERKPTKAIVGAVRSVFRTASVSPLARDGIGNRLSVLVLPGDRGIPTTADYLTDTALGHAWYPSQVETLPGRPCFAVEKMLFNLHDESGRPGVLTIPVVGRNKPCPCGSGKKFKKCHGAAGAGSAPTTLAA